MCIVYQAWDTRQERFVAIKRLEPPLNQDPRTRARFDREGRALALLDHPNLVALVDRGSTENDDYLVFEYVEGRSLKELIREGHMSIEVFGLIVGQVAEGLAHAHKAGIVHRDVKPQNILIDRMGHAKVSDFGIATGPDWTRVTKAGAVIGSARYMSPEQIRSKPVDPRSDIYSLGIVMYEMLTGRTPFDGNNMPEIARLHLQAPPPPMTDARTKMPPGLDTLVLRCLEKDPDDRFESMEEVIGALVGLGLYKLRADVESTTSHRWPLRRGPAEDERPRRGQEGAPGTAGARPPGEEGDKHWAREQARETARKRRSSKRRRLGVLAAIVLLVIIVVPILTCGGGEAPNVVGMTLDDATQLARAAGLEVVTEEIPSFDATAGTVLSQSPAEGIKSDDKKLYLSLAREPVQVQINLIDDYDPQGDNAENPTLTGALIDGDLATAWSTEGYKSPTFQGIPGKTGVGLVFALAEGATMVRISSSVNGWIGEVQMTTPEGGTSQVAQLGGQQVVTWREPLSSGRIWFTQLAPLPDSTKFGVVIAEIGFYK
jgi:serine/threonine-protein kinase